MGKIRYICTTCANGFTTRGAATRHVKRIERGMGIVVTEAEYRIGLSTGKFIPASPGNRPPYRREPPDLVAIASEEYHRGFWRRFGELDCEGMFKDEAKRGMLRRLIQLHQMQQISKLFE